jgi:iron complex outermembrane receptor protein
VGTYSAGDTDVHLLFNHTDTEVTAFNPDTLSEGRIQQLEEALPKTRAAVALTQTINKLRLMGRVSTYSGWYDADDAFSYDGGHVLVDLEGAYRFGQRVTLVVGGTNVLNHYPDENPSARAGVGNLYSQYTPFGFNGAFWSSRLKFEFCRRRSRRPGAAGAAGGTVFRT